MTRMDMLLPVPDDPKMNRSRSRKGRAQGGLSCDSIGGDEPK